MHANHAETGPIYKARRVKSKPEDFTKRDMHINTDWIGMTTLRPDQRAKPETL